VLRRLLQKAKKALKRYRTKVVVPASHLRVLRSCEEAIDRWSIELDLFEQVSGEW
jgi:hypothetical protein